MLKIYFLLFLLHHSICFSEDKTISLSQKTQFKAGDKITLLSSSFLVTIGYDKGSKCAIPNFNCGSGYIPPHFTFKIDCGDLNPCPYIVMTNQKNAATGELSIEDEKSCEQNDPKNCFGGFARSFKTDKLCLKLKSPLGRYYCLEFFNDSNLIEAKGLCDQLPDNIYALKWNCFYEYAIRYKDPSYCDKYSLKEISGRDRCLLKMAELLNDHSLCKKISLSTEHSYLEQCLKLK